jgi:DpnII restriction endonuclease
MDADQALGLLADYESQLAAILSRFKQDREGLHIKREDDARTRQIILELRDFFDDEFVGGRNHSLQLVHAANNAEGWTGALSYAGVESIKGIVSAALARVRRNPSAIKSTATAPPAGGGNELDILTKLAARLPLVARQLRKRHGQRPTLDVTDEYDVQDLLHSILTIHFDDIRPEEWTPSYAGGSSRMDFLLPEIEAVIETKMARQGLTGKQLGDELLIDIARYAEHPRCRTLYCIIYDPEGRIANARGLETISRATKGISQSALRSFPDSACCAISR